MGLWVLEPKSKGKVPGTVHVERETEEQQAVTANLKHGSDGDEHIVLVPQPSDSPNDPLNWPRRSKLVHSWWLAAGTGLASGVALFLNPSNAVIAKQVHTTTVLISRTTSVLLLFIGVGAIITAPLARMYGKRPVFLLLNLISVIGYIIFAARPKSLAAIFVGRAFYGFGLSGLSYIVTSSVGDLFFVHQRGFHLALWHWGLSGGNQIGQVIASQIVQKQSYVWAVRYAVILMSAYLVGTFFLIPETAYIRNRKYDTDVVERLADEAGSTSPDEPNISEKGHPTPNVVESGSDLSEKRKTYAQQLKVYNGRFSNEGYFSSLLPPFVTLLLPATAWAAYCYGSYVALTSAFSVSLSQLFSVPPYNFKVSSIGLTVLSAFIGTIFGNLVPGPTADWLVKYMSRKNNGIYEPEFRTLLCIPPLVLGLAGYWGFGLSIKAGNHWIVPVFFFGLATFAGSSLSLISNAYLLDCHRKYNQDAYAVVNLVKAVMSFIISFFMNDWITHSGVVQVFFIIGLIHAIGGLSGIFLYFYGKRIRLRVHNNRFLQAHLRVID